MLLVHLDRAVMNKRSRGDKGAMTPKISSISCRLCFERRCPQPNAVARLKSKYLVRQTILGWLRYFCDEDCFNSADTFIVSDEEDWPHLNICFLAKFDIFLSLRFSSMRLGPLPRVHRHALHL